MYDLPKGLLDSIIEPFKNGFLVVITIVLSWLFYLMFNQRSTKTPYMWFIAHILGILISGYLFFELLTTNIKNSQGIQSWVYDEISYRFKFIGLIWIVSLFCLLIGINCFRKQK
jgi:hypothetical protein